MKCSSIWILVPLGLLACESTAPHGRHAAGSDEQTTLAALADELVERDVVFLGEEHGNAVGHLQQRQLLALLHDRRPDLALSLEMLERDQQADLDAYLSGEIDEAEFIERSGLSDAYVERHRPLVEFCRRHALPVIAANLPRELAAQIRTEGVESVAGDPHAPRRITAPKDAYWDAFKGAMADGHGGLDEAMLYEFYLAQNAWDDAMAEAIADFLDEAPAPAPLVVHVVGNFHVQDRLGTVRKLEQRRPDLDIAVVEVESRTNHAPLRDGRDFVLYLPPQPELPDPPADAADGDDEAPEVPTDPGRPALGFMPDYQAAVDGMRIDSLRPGGPAEQAGLRAGDVIVELDGVAIDGMDAYLEILGSLTPGREVVVVVLRDGEQTETTVTVGRRID